MTSRHRSTGKSWKLALAAAGVAGFLSASALGQARVDTGNALDANNRVGSGGLNSGGSVYNQNALNNAIVTGNVTGGREFRGNVPYSPTNAFRGSLAGSGIDRFVANSAGTGGNYTAQNSFRARPFIGQSEGIGAPTGFQQVGNSGAFVYNPPATDRQIGDTRFGWASEGPSQALPRPGEFIMPGPVDPTGAGGSPGLITASPLYGIRSLNPGDAVDRRFIERYTGALGDNRPGESDAMALERLRQELNDPANDESTDPTKTTDLPGTQLDSATPNQPLKDGLSSSSTASDPLGAGLGSGQQITNRVVLPSLVRQSPQYRDLQQRLAKFGNDPTRQFNEERKLKEEMEAAASRPPGPTSPGGPGTGGPSTGGPGLGGPGVGSPTTGSPGAGTTATGGTGVGEGTALPPGGIMPGTRVPVVAERPTISSLATGIKAKTAADLLTEAEKLMREQKFNAALEKYDFAEQVAPNDPVVLLGRAHAELGAASYGRAEGNLRRALSAEPSLMMARYDLRAFLGDERLATVQKDLKDIAKNEPTAVRPLVLLAYLAYNDGNDRLASGYVDLAEKRSTAKDPFFAALRKYWDLPAYGTDPAGLDK